MSISIDPLKYAPSSIVIRAVVRSPTTPVYVRFAPRAVCVINVPPKDTQSGTARAIFLPAPSPVLRNRRPGNTETGVRPPDQKKPQD